MHRGFGGASVCEAGSVTPHAVNITTEQKILRSSADKNDSLICLPFGLVDGDGVEPPQLEAPDLQSGGLANAQPIL